MVVVGNGMVGHRFLEMLGERATAAGQAPFDVTIIGEEPRLAYDRVGLSAFFDGKTADDLALARPGQYEAAGFAVRLSTRVRRIDRKRRVVEADGAEIPYDRLVLATGSSAFVPPVPGRDLPGCFVYRTIEDLVAISAWAARHPGGTGAVI
ncbi:MAG TPA: FAD-dependent oxidoreductase, partial [Polyangia bacterium]|nr:FAD-dependent oxidoreductase [Polyangia bacterium]